MKYITLLLLFALTLHLNAQDCQQISLKLPVIEGIAKHHFPPQEMPISATEDSFFTYHSSWDQGDLVVKIRFSADGATWTKWEVLKKDFTQPEAKSSPLHLASEAYQHFEWAVFNKAGLESELAINFYYMDDTPIIAANSTLYDTEISTVACPLPELMDVSDQSTIVGNGKDDDDD